MSTTLEKSLTTPPPRRHNELHRSVSDAHPSSMSKHHHHLHHPHLPGHQRRRENHSASPALHPGRSSADHIYDPKNEAATPNGSRRASIRPSILGREDLDGTVDVEINKEKPPITPGQVKREKEKNALRTAELRDSLVELNTLSNITTRQLDSTYYSVLEKHSILQSTISSMQELALAAQKLDQDFKSDSNEIVSEVVTQLLAFRNFTDQRQKIERYAARVGAGRERVKVLCDRLETVQTKVEKWEKSEGEWQQRTRRRLRILWTVVITCVLVFVALVVFQYHSTVRSYHGGEGHLSANVDFDALDEEPGVANETLEGIRKIFERERGELGEDPRLRVFDEL